MAATAKKYNIMYLLVAIINSKKNIDVSVKATPILPQGNTTKRTLFSSKFNVAVYVQ